MTFLYYLPHSDLLFVYVWRWTLLQIASTWHFCWVELLCEPGQRPATSPGIRDRSFRRATPSASWGDWLCTGAWSEQKPWMNHEYPINIYIYIYIYHCPKASGGGWSVQCLIMFFLGPKTWGHPEDIGEYMGDGEFLVEESWGAAPILKAQSSRILSVEWCSIHVWLTWLTL